VIHVPDDPTVQIAAIGIITTLITTAGIIVVAVLNNRKERSGAAQEGIEGTLRERILLRDEQIADLREELVHKERIIERLKAKIERLEGSTNA